MTDKEMFLLVAEELKTLAVFAHNAKKRVLPSRLCLGKTEERFEHIGNSCQAWYRKIYEHLDNVDQGGNQ